MGVLSNEQKSVTLIPSIVTMNQTLDMTLFLITDYVLENAPKGGIIMTITMKRKILSEMMTTFFPSLLLMMITYATTFFKPFFFEAALSVNLTTMLVMTTIFISKMEGLPPTSDIKMIDIWLVLCQMVPFAEVILLTAMEYNRKDKKKKKKKKGKNRSRTKGLKMYPLTRTTEDKNQENVQNRSVQMNLEHNNDSDNQEHRQCRRCWTLDLKTIGAYIF